VIDCSFLFATKERALVKVAYFLDKSSKSSNAPRGRNEKEEEVVGRLSSIVYSSEFVIFRRSILRKKGYKKSGSEKNRRAQTRANARAQRTLSLSLEREEEVKESSLLKHDSKSLI